MRIVRSLTRIAAFICGSFVLLACDGEFNCPANRPACCDNVLFGCGPFELPDGCSCSTYFSSSAFSSEATRAYSITRSSTGPGFTGTYRTRLTAPAKVCPGFLPTIGGAVRVRDSRGRVVVTVPGYGVLRGRAVGASLQAKGSYRPLLSACSAALALSMSAPTPTSRVAVNIAVTCRGIRSCNAQYSGSATRSP
jgi:hypothetical protein